MANKIYGTYALLGKSEQLQDKMLRQECGCRTAFSNGADIPIGDPSENTAEGEVPPK